MPELQQQLQLRRCPKGHLDSDFRSLLRRYTLIVVLQLLCNNTCVRSMPIRYLFAFAAMMCTFKCLFVFVVLRQNSLHLGPEPYVPHLGRGVWGSHISRSWSRMPLPRLQTLHVSIMRKCQGSSRARAQPRGCQGCQGQYAICNCFSIVVLKQPYFSCSVYVS